MESEPKRWRGAEADGCTPGLILAALNPLVEGGVVRETQRELH